MEIKTQKRFIPIGKDYLVWHYTSPDVLVKLLNDEIYATHYRFLNDDEEISYALKVCLDFFQNRLQGFDIDLFIKMMLKQDVFVMCFSTAKDSLSQWRAYTSNQKGGFAIGFSKNKLCSYLNYAMNKKKGADVKGADVKGADVIDWGWIKCLYSKESLHHCLLELENLLKQNVELTPSFMQFMNGVSNAVTQKGQNGKKALEVMQDSYMNLERMSLVMNHLFNIALSYKHPSFAEENEERILGFGVNLAVIDGLPLKESSKHRHDIEFIGGKPRIRIPIPFHKPKHSVKDCIKCIVVSPHGDKERNTLMAELLRDKYDLQIEIEQSSSSYNGK